MSTVESRSVAWWPVHEWVQTYLDGAGDYPMAGTPAWCSLPDNDRRKWAALLDAAQHHILRIEIAQEQRAEASKSVAAACDWSAVSNEIRNRTEFRMRRAS